MDSEGAINKLSNCITFGTPLCNNRSNFSEGKIPLVYLGIHLPRPSKRMH